MYEIDKNHKTQIFYLGELPKADTNTFDTVMRKIPMIVRLFTSSALD